ncbi:hypothetical protein Tco_0500759 [Tanacetum coccineum]
METGSENLLESLKLLQRQLFRSLEDWEVSSLQCMQQYRNCTLKKDSWKELQFNLVDNSKLNVVYLLNRS